MSTTGAYKKVEYALMVHPETPSAESKGKLLFQHLFLKGGAVKSRLNFKTFGVKVFCLCLNPTKAESSTKHLAKPTEDTQVEAHKK